MSIVLALVSVASLIIGVSHYWDPSLPLAGNAPLRSFWKWVGTGIFGPLAIWCFFNAGLGVSPLLPQISQAQQAGAGMDAFARYTAAALFIIVTWWAAISMAWIAWEIRARTPDRPLFLNAAFMSLLVAAPVAAFIVLLFRHAGFGLACAMVFGAVVHGTRGLVPARLPAGYSRALARIAFDKFNEAEWEIIKELESHENDFDGWMMLAELYAIHFNDLPSAEQTICELCDEPNTDASQISVALNRLADWQLKAGNIHNARWALEQICRKLPGTHMARMAEARIRRLDESGHEAGDGPAEPIKLTPMPDVVRIQPARHAPLHPEHPPEEPDWNAPTIRLRTEPVVDARVAAIEEANRCVEKLTANPNDAAERERFAHVLAEKLGKAAEAIAQLDLLIALRGQPAGLRVGWLAKRAEWQIRLLRDNEGAQSTLQRIARDFPGTAEAFDAQRRLYVLQLEKNVKQKRKGA